MKKLLSIVIVNWNVAELLAGAIQSILNNPPTGDYEIIVVDNASKDSSLEMLASDFPVVKVIANKQNEGFGKANNRGMEVAEGEHIFLLNPDTVVIGDTLDQLIGVLKNHPEIGMVGPMLVNDENLEPQPGGARLTRTFMSGVLLDLLYVNRIPWIGAKLVKKLRYPYDLTKESYVEVISGSAMMFKDSTIKRIGGFDERFFMAGEDVELCDRFWQNGYKVYYFPIARIIHLTQSCTPLNPVYIFVNRFLSVAKYYEHKYGKWTHDCFRSATYLILIPKLLIKIVFYAIVNDQEKRKMNKAILSLLVKWRFVGDAGGLN
jgi:N-acetylglucosaminyl-diphospho-decaprenol L-rhamnosyltransferase